MQALKQDFTPRQYMVTPDFEFFHYRDESTMEIDYHNHDFYEIYFFFSGKVTYLIEGKSYRLRPGDILLINNRGLHKPIIEPGEPYERMVVWVNPSFVARQSTENTDLNICFESLSRNNHNLLRLHPETLSIIRNSLLKFEKACYSVGFGNQILKKIYLTELIVHLNRVFLDDYETKIEVDMEYNEKVNNIIHYINENLNSDLSLDTLSSKFYSSKYHLLREFKKYAGYTLHQYVSQKRLIMAKSLLKEGVQVTEVCMQCGFGDYSNFIRSFKKAFGLSPRKYYRLHA